MNFDQRLRESIVREFHLHELRRNDEPLKASIQREFPLLRAVANPFYRESAGRRPRDGTAAREHAEWGRGARANLAVERVVFVTSHAIEIVIVNHPHDGRPGVGERGKHLQVRELVEKNHLRAELAERESEHARVTSAGQWKAFQKDFVPS